MPPTTLRNIRIEDELWTAAQAKAHADGLPLSEVVRELLRAYISEPREGSPEQP